MGVIVIRHGKTALLEAIRERNIKGKATNFSDAMRLAQVREEVSSDSPLSQTGIKQVEKIIPQIADFYVDSVYISESQRTQQTYDILSHNIPDLPHSAVVSNGLNQVESGVLHGIINENSQAYFETLPETAKKRKSIKL